MGRTGTFITIDQGLEQVGKEGVVDIPGVINNIRHQRMKLVQTVVRPLYPLLSLFLHCQEIYKPICARRTSTYSSTMLFWSQ